MGLRMSADGVAVPIGTPDQVGPLSGVLAHNKEIRTRAFRRQRVEHLLGRERGRSIVERQDDFVVAKRQCLRILLGADLMQRGWVDDHRAAGADRIGMFRAAAGVGAEGWERQRDDDGAGDEQKPRRRGRSRFRLHGGSSMSPAEPRALRAVTSRHNSGRFLTPGPVGGRKSEPALRARSTLGKFAGDKAAASHVGFAWWCQARSSGGRDVLVVCRSAGRSSIHVDFAADWSRSLVLQPTPST